jgi:uncharacterized protein (TIGR00730 family)
MDIITVFSGLSRDNSVKGLGHCKKVGEIVAEKGYTLVCAGASIGCQSKLIEGAQEKGGKVIAVTVPMFKDELSESLKNDAIVTEGSDLSKRKQTMKNLTEFGYIILPGGPGTLDELWEVFSEKSENVNNGGNKRLIIINTDGFYEPIKDQIKIMRDTFNWQSYGEGVEFIDDPEELNRLIPQYNANPLGGTRKSYRKKKTIKNKSRKYKKTK